jgi:predicted kinase
MDALGINLHREDSRARIEALQWRLGQRLLTLGLVVIIEWGTWARAERDALRLGARALGAAVELHYVSAPPAVLIERVRRRAREDPPLDDDAIHRWFDVFQAPTVEELALFDPPTIRDANVRSE